jgi:hypothetical protein
MMAADPPPPMPITVDWSKVADPIVAQVTELLPVILPVAGGIVALVLGWALLRHFLEDEFDGATAFERADLLAGEAENDEEIQALNDAYDDNYRSY